MKYGIREICEVVLKAKSNRKIGNKMFYKGEPVIYFDSLKTSTLEGATTTVYATGGRGNARLMAWEGERTVTFTMEDALISPLGLMILTGAGLVEGDKVAPVHTVEPTTEVSVEADEVVITLTEAPSKNSNAAIYVMVKDGDDIVTEPYIAQAGTDNTVVIKAVGDYKPDLTQFKNNCSVIVDYYVDKKSATQQIEITPESFAGNFYLEASTLFRATSGEDHPAEFVIPNCKVQSNFSFALAATGDPTTFTFTMDAFPDYTMFDPTKKVICMMQIIDPETDMDSKEGRKATAYDYVGI